MGSGLTPTLLLLRRALHEKDRTNATAAMTPTAMYSPLDSAALGLGFCTMATRDWSTLSASSRLDAEVLYITRTLPRELRLTHGGGHVVLKVGVKGRMERTRNAA